MEHMLDADLERLAAIALPHEVFTKKIEGIVPHVVGEKPGEKHFTEHATFKLYRPLEGKEEGTAILDMMYATRVHKARKQIPHIYEGTWKPTTSPADSGKGTRFIRTHFPKKVSFYSAKHGFAGGDRGAVDPLDLNLVALHLWDSPRGSGRSLQSE